MRLKILCNCIKTKRPYPTLFDEIIHMYDTNNEKNENTKHMAPRQLYNYRIKNKPMWVYGNVNIYDVYKTIYERDIKK